MTIAEVLGMLLGMRTGPAPASTSPSRLGLPKTIRACPFDPDGVLTHTAAAQAAAWQAMSDAFLFARATRKGDPAGVAAGREGHFGFVVGLDSVDQSAALRTEGADVVVSGLAEVLEQP